MRSRYDVIVVGAGPGGAAAAYHAAASGLSTLLLDRKTFPRAKVCGDGLTPRALSALARMQLGYLCDRHRRIDGVRVTDGVKSAEFSCASESGLFNFGLVVPRKELDTEIAAAAARVGAEFVQDASAVNVLAERAGRVAGVLVKHAQGCSVVSADVTVVADGSTGRLSRLLNRGVSRTASCAGFAARQYLTGIDSLSSVFEVHMPLEFGEEWLPGYAWVFPVTDTDANVGVGLLERPTNGRVSVTDVLATFVALLARRDPRFAKLRPAGPVEGGALSVRMVDPLLTPRGAFLVGDAAGLVNPYTGEGIASALESGELAAQAALRALQGRGDPTVWYARRLASLFPLYWAVRDAPRHLRWVYTAARSANASQGRNGLVAALRNVAVDDPRRQPVRDCNLSGDTRSTKARRLGLASRIVARMRRTDAVIAETVAELLRNPASPAAYPILVGDGIAGRVLCRDRVLSDGLIALAMFVLAQDLTAQIVGACEDTFHAADASAIVLTDCLLTEATDVLACLPERWHRAIARAVSSSAAAQRDLVDEDRSALAVQKSYLALAAPTVCAAELAAQALGLSARATRARTVFAEWYAATRYAMRDVSQRREPHLIRIVADQLALRACRTPRDDVALQRLASGLEEETRGCFGLPQAADFGDASTS